MDNCHPHRNSHGFQTVPKRQKDRSVSQYWSRSLGTRRGASENGRGGGAIATGTASVPPEPEGGRSSALITASSTRLPCRPSSRPPRGHRLLIDLRSIIFGPEPSKNCGLLGFLITASLLGRSSSKNSGNRKSEVSNERKPKRELGTELLRFRCRGCF